MALIERAAPRLPLPHEASCPRIAIVVVGTEGYGVQRFTTSFIRAVVSVGIECSVIATSDGPMLSACREAGASVRLSPVRDAFDVNRSSKSVADMVRVFRRGIRAAQGLAAAIRATSCDVVLVRTPELVPLVARASAIAGRKSAWILPNLVSDRLPFGAIKIFYDLLMARYGMTPIANSRFTRGSLLNWLAPGKVAHLGIDSREFDSRSVIAASRPKFGIAEADPVFGIFARLTKEKGQGIFLEALAKIGSASRAHLLVCGGPLDSRFGYELLGSVDALGLRGRVTFTGPIRDPRPLYAMCDVIVNSRIDPEPFGLSVIEAMMMGKPVLVHALGGPAETVIDGKTGWHVGSPTVTGFVAGIARALNERQRWHEIGAAARTHAIANFEIASATARILTIVGESARDDRFAAAAARLSARRFA